MKVTYDAAVDALNIDLSDDEQHLASHAEVRPGVYLGWTDDKRLVNIELLNASQHIPRVELERLPTGVEMLTPAELSAEHGLSAGSIGNLAAAGKLTGAVKRGGTWLIPAHEFENYLALRAPSGRPPASRKAKQVRRRQQEAVSVKRIARTGGSGR